MIALWIALAFLSGSLPFSYWLGRLALGTDIRQVGDGNPGATNVARAGSKKLAALAGLLDALKGAVPVGLAYWSAGLTGWQLVAVALAPVLGHAFSPFLGFRGGKAVAVTFGIWTGLTLYEAPTVLGLMLFYWFRFIRISGWALMAALASLAVYLLLARPDPTLLQILALNTVVLAWKYRADLTLAPDFRPQKRLLWWSSPSS